MIEGRHPPGGGSGSQNRFFPQLKAWADQYAPAGVEDQRAVHTYMECETREAHATLRNELRSIAGGQYRRETLDIIIGQGRVAKHGSYDAWAKLMLLWMSSYKS